MLVRKSRGSLPSGMAADAGVVCIAALLSQDGGRTRLHTIPQEAVPVCPNRGAARLSLATDETRMKHGEEASNRPPPGAPSQGRAGKSVFSPPCFIRVSSVA